MVSKSVWWFLAGASAFHTLLHAFYWVAGTLPLDFKWFTLTFTLNQIELWGSVLLTALFVYLAREK